jgi:hypothetical protein
LSGAVGHFDQTTFKVQGSKSNVRDVRLTLDLGLWTGFCTSDVSLTVTVHEELKTQLIAGAETLTTFKGVSMTTEEAKHNSGLMPKAYPLSTV